jgi:hypothetical protein
MGSQEKKCLPFKCIHRVPVFDIFQIRKPKSGILYDRKEQNEKTIKKKS